MEGKRRIGNHVRLLSSQGNHNEIFQICIELG